MSAGPKDGIITLKEIKDYVSTSMGEETLKVLGRAQYPTIATSSGDPDIWNLNLQTYSE